VQKGDRRGESRRKDFLVRGEGEGASSGKRERERAICLKPLNTRGGEESQPVRVCEIKEGSGVTMEEMSQGRR